MASCPNCKIPCTGCAGARLTPASDGKTVCTKCIGSYEQQLRLKKAAQQGPPTQSPPPGI